MILFANTASAATADEIGRFILVLSVLVAVGVNLVTLWRGNRARAEISPQPLDVRLADQFVTRNEAAASDHRLTAVENRVLRLEQQIESSFHRVAEQIQSADERAEDRARRIHQRIDALSVAISEKIGRLEGQFHQLNLDQLNLDRDEKK